MEYISRAGLAWLDHHAIGIDWLQRESQHRTAFHRPLADRNCPDWNYLKTETLRFRGGLWMLSQESGGLSYREIGTRHAKLIIANTVLTETVCSSVRKAPIDLEKIVELPEGSFARDANGKIIRVRNTDDGDVELLLRIDWLDMTTACYSQRIAR